MQSCTQCIYAFLDLNTLKPCKMPVVLDALLQCWKETYFCLMYQDHDFDKFLWLKDFCTSWLTSLFQTVLKKVMIEFYGWVGSLIRVPFGGFCFTELRIELLQIYLGYIWSTICLGIKHVFTLQSLAKLQSCSPVI